MLPDLNKTILEKAKKAYKSGAIDLSDYENNYSLPRIFLSAMGTEIRWLYEPHGKENLNTRDNLAHFL